MTEHQIDRPQEDGETSSRGRRSPIVGSVVVGVDGSGEAHRGMEFGARLAQQLDVELVVVHALGLLVHLGGRRQPAEGNESEVARRLRDEWCAALDDRPELRWRCELVQGNPVDALLRTADEVDAAFIVVGSHGAGNSDTPLLGSTSHHVVRNSHRPVIVVPPDDNHPHRRVGAGAMSSGIADA